MNAQQQFALEVFQMDEQTYNANWQRILDTDSSLYGTYDKIKIDTCTLYNFINSVDYKDAEEIYNALAEKAVMNEGFNADQTSLIMSEAWDRGHSAGYTEVALYLMEIVTFCIQLQKRA